MTETVVWILQVVVALAFGMAGIMKLMQPKEKLQERMAWVNDFSQNQIRLIGLVEILGAIGVILPILLNVLPILTPLAAAGLTLTMLGAALVHLRRQEYPMIGINFVLGLLAALVFIGRMDLLNM
ncbi:MAG: DoxX family protein [Anaerolineae bacterium]|nr:DoxX family protein [Anaerolineae bacterium]MCB9458207.1 DoxX family protein [Anaerolineaceae bacterium]